jgi:hypothetical protein
MLKLSEFSSSKKQGDAGLAVAISSFVLSGYTVCIPLTDSQEYDLIVGLGINLYKVQVKTSTEKDGIYNKVQLRTRTTKGGKNFFKSFDNSLVDYLFILTSEGDKFLIPSKEIIVKTAITLGEKYSKYKIGT